MPTTPGTKKTILSPLTALPNIYRSNQFDDFLRSDTSTGGAGSTSGVGNGWIDVQGGVSQIASNQLKLTSDSVDIGQYARDFTVRPPVEATLDHSIEFDIPAQVWNAAASFGPVLRYQSASKNCYLVRIKGDGTVCAIFKLVAGIPTTIGPTATIPGFSQGFNYHSRFSIEGTNLNFELTNRDTGAVVFNIQISDSSITTAGTAGFVGPWDVVASSVLLDNATVSSSSTIKLGIVGDSIYASVPPTGLKTPGSSLARELGTRCRREYVLSNQAISGKTSADWANDVGNIMTAAKTAFASAGVTDISVMLGTNDSKTAVATTKSAFKVNIQTICTSLNGSGYRVFLHAPPYLTPGAFGQFDLNSPGLLLQYRDALAEAANGASVILGDNQSFNFFKRFQNQLADLLHPTVDGGEALATLHAETMWKYLV